MTDPRPVRPETEILPPVHGTLSIPPPVPQKQPGFLRRLFTSRKQQQTVAIQNGYLEMVDLIRAIRSHLDRQETVQTSVLTLLEKVPNVMERQHEVMTIFKEQLEKNMENDRRLTDSMGKLNGTLSGIDESQKASSRTITDLIHRSRESEQLLREVMRRAERRMTLLLVVFFLLVIGMGFYFVRWQNRAAPPPAQAPTSTAIVAAPAAIEIKTVAPVEEKIVTAEPVKAKKSKRKSRAKTTPIPEAAVETAPGQSAVPPDSLPSTSDVTAAVIPTVAQPVSVP